MTDNAVAIVLGLAAPASALAGLVVGRYLDRGAEHRQWLRDRRIDVYRAFVRGSIQIGLPPIEVHKSDGEPEQADPAGTDQRAELERRRAELEQRLAEREELYEHGKEMLEDVVPLMMIVCDSKVREAAGRLSEAVRAAQTDESQQAGLTDLVADLIVLFREELGVK